MPPKAVAHVQAMEWMSYSLFYEQYQHFFFADHDETNNEWQNLVTRLPAARKRVSGNGQLEIAIIRERQDMETRRGH